MIVEPIIFEDLQFRFRCNAYSSSNYRIKKKKIIKIKKYISHTKKTTIICANAQHLADKIKYINVKIKKKINIFIIPELIILLMNTARSYPCLVNVIVLRWISTSSNGSMNSISELIQIIKKMS
jgi:hypothetical protein